ncbi:DNA mismatch repair protein [Tanacetum coccineum]
MAPSPEGVASPHNQDPITIEKPAPVSKSVLDPTSPEKTSDALEVIDISTPPNSSQPALDAPDPSHPKMCYTLWFSFEELKKKRQQKLSAFQASKSTPRFSLTKGCYADATLEHSQVVKEDAKARALSAATSELEKLFKKEDFGRMKVIGQFNLGFIIGKLDQDLFIVDQVLRLYHLSILNLTHAADEKYNYEHLPILVELSPEEEVIVSMHMDTIRKNGFSLEEDVNATPGHRYRLKAVPFSKNITFGVSDVKELISILADSEGECSMMGTYKMDTADSVCPPRVRAMLASRACRSSVMIGDPLGRNEMQKFQLLNSSVFVSVVFVIVDSCTFEGSQITMELSTWKTDNASLASTLTSNTGYMSGIEPLNGTNFSTRRDQVKLTLGVMDLDHALRIDPPAALTAESTADQKRAYE